jgi:biopolymer transport protein ExbB/TolQ
METAAWILVIFLSTALFLFIVVGIVLLIKLIDFTKEAKKIVVQSQDIAEKADDIVGNVRDMTTVGGLVKHFVNAYTESEAEKTSSTKKGKKS